MRTRPALQLSPGDPVLIKHGLRHDTPAVPGEVVTVRRKYLSAAPLTPLADGTEHRGTPIDFEIETGAARDFIAAQNGSRLLTAEILDFEIEQGDLVDRLRKASPGDSFRWADRVTDLDALEKVVRIIEQATR